MSDTKIDTKNSDYENVQSWANYDNSVDCPIDEEDFTEQEGPWNDVEFMIERYKQAGQTLHDIRNDPYGFTTTGEDVDANENPVPRYALDPVDIQYQMARNTEQKANSMKVEQTPKNEASPIPQQTQQMTDATKPQNEPAPKP